MKLFVILLLTFFALPAFAASGNEVFYKTAEFWVAMSFLLVFIFLIKPISKAVMSILHGRVDSVLATIQNVVGIRDDAKKLLENYDAKQKSLKKEVDLLLKTALNENEFLKQQAMQKIKNESLAKQKELSSKLLFLENNAKQEIIEMIADKTIENIALYMQKKQDKKSQQKLVSKAINSL